jgi:hypothetical protein
MASTLKSAVRDLFKDAKRSKGAIKRLLNPSQTGAGSRVHPPQTQKKDEKFGVRIDKGQALPGGKVQLNLQINSNATKKSLKDLDQKNGSHTKYVTVEVDPNQEATEDNMNKLEEEFVEAVDNSNAV